MRLKKANLFDEIPADLVSEVSNRLAFRQGVRIERIVSRGHHSPEGFWYDQGETEWVLLLRGAAKLRFEKDDLVVDMKPGDHIMIAPRARHRVEWTTPDEDTIWLAVFY